MEKVRIGVFGADRGMTMVNQILARDDAELVAVCDRNESALGWCKHVAEEAGMNHVAYYTDFEDFIKHEGMDAAVLANYANEHVPFAIRLMESGRHVMTECLTCATMKEAVELIECVERTGMIYTYAENYCYTPARWEMRERYRRGDIGELMYAEGEYIHDCSSIWPEITYGQRNHWRNLMPSTFYCTHSIGPILYMTGLRPVQVTGFETPNMPFMRKLGTASGTLGMEVITLENGAVVKSLHGLGCSKDSIWYTVYGSKGRLETAREDAEAGGVSMVYENLDAFEGENRNHPVGAMVNDDLAVKGAAHGHGGSDYICLYNAIEHLNGNPDAEIVDVYEAVNMWMCGQFAYFSVLSGGGVQRIPDLKDPAERDAWRNDLRCTVGVEGDDLLPSYSKGNPEIPASVYAGWKEKWDAKSAK